MSINFAGGLIRNANNDHANNPQQHIVNTLTDYRKAIGNEAAQARIPACFADLHHFPNDYKADMTLQEVLEIRTQILDQLHKNTDAVLHFLPKKPDARDEIWPHPWPYLYELDLFQFQIAERNRFLDLVRESFRTVKHNFKAKASEADRAYKELQKNAVNNTPEGFQQRMKLFSGHWKETINSQSASYSHYHVRDSVL